MRVLAFAPVLALTVSLIGPAAAQSWSRGPAGPPPPDRDLRCVPEDPGQLVHSAEVDLAGYGGCSASQAWPWTVAVTPDGQRVYATLFGGLIGNGGCTVVRLHPVTHQVIGSFQVGESPEEIAFVVDGAGALLYGFVTNSSSSTVSVFDASDTVVATIAIPFHPSAPYPTAFPFGLAVAPDQRTVYVGTHDGRGNVFAIDVQTMSLVPAKSFQVGADHAFARMVFVGETLVVPTTLDTDAPGSTAKLVFADTGSTPVALGELTLDGSATDQRLPSPQDVAVDCDGRLYVAGFDMGRRVWVVDPATPAVLGTIPANTTGSNGKYTGLGLSPAGLLCVTDLFTSEISVIDTWTGTWITTIDPQVSFPTFYAQPHEAVFAPDGETLFVTFATSENVAVLDVL